MWCQLYLSLMYDPVFAGTFMGGEVIPLYIILSLASLSDLLSHKSVLCSLGMCSSGVWICVYIVVNFSLGHNWNLWYIYSIHRKEIDLSFARKALHLVNQNEGSLYLENGSFLHLCILLHIKISCVPSR